MERLRSQVVPQEDADFPRYAHSPELKPVPAAEVTSNSHGPLISSAASSFCWPLGDPLLRASTGLGWRFAEAMAAGAADAATTAARATTVSHPIA